jgi:hypothetical protein
MVQFSARAGVWLRTEGPVGLVAFLLAAFADNAGTSTNETAPIGIARSVIRCFINLCLS